MHVLGGMHDTDVQIEPHLFGVFAAVSWCQCLLYENGLSVQQTVGAFFCFTGLYGFIEVTSIFAMKVGPCHSKMMSLASTGCRAES